MKFFKMLAGLAYPVCTICLTVLAFIFFSMCIVEGMNISDMLKGAWMLGWPVSISTVFGVEFILAFILEMTIGHPFSTSMVNRHCPHGTPAIVSYAVSVGSTVLVMCPAMSLLAAVLYSPQPLTPGFLLVRWVRLVCINLPFVFFLQILFLQPFLQWIFGCGYRLKGRFLTEPQKN